MNKKQTPLKPPSLEAINRVLANAYAAPQPNCEAAKQTMAAIDEVSAFFQVLLKPQASANAGGNSSDVTQPAGRPARPT